MIAIFDYGAGNLQSVKNTLGELGCPYTLVRDSAGLRNASKILLPGVGHFGQMMRALDELDVRQTLLQRILAGVPFLGICLGLQALYETSEEAPEVQGLGLLPGRVSRFQGVFKVPHVGWSQLEIRNNTGLFRGIADGSFVYFCHSYYGPATKDSSAVTHYGQTFAAGVEMKNIWAVQFHPEKSGEVGLKVLANFLGL